MKLILLPGLDGTGKLFEPLLSYLPDKIDTQVIVYPNDTLLTYIELTEFVMSKLPKDENYILLAESFSGMVAYSIAQKIPKNLSSIIFVASFIENPRPNVLKILTTLPFKFLYYISPPKLVLNYIFCNKIATPIFLSKFQTILKSMPLEVLLWRLKQISSLKKASEKINIEIYYLYAKKDKLVPKKVLPIFNRLFNKSMIYTLNNGHLVLQCMPYESAKIIAEIYQSILCKSTPLKKTKL